ncbi:Hypothetical protein PBC10988_36380 [Planctomycetales bacterium 10988]|nr:Hypothetical protein PBC10988_36380 [Planctomycetales bacterium 10988]
MASYAFKKDPRVWVLLIVILLLVFLYESWRDRTLERFFWSADRRANPQGLTLLTYNTQFLWDGREPEEGQVEFPWKHSPILATQRMQQIAQVIDAANPDIASLIEVENFQTIALLNRQFLPKKQYREYLVPGKDVYTGQDLGLLSKVDFYTVYHDERKGRSGPERKSVSKNYVATLEIDPFPITLIGVHLLANPKSEERRYLRQAQADAISQIACEAAARGHEVIVWGDFNDYDGNSQSLDLRGNEPITSVLQKIRRQNPNDPNDDLLNVTMWVDPAKRYTSIYDRNQNGKVDGASELSAIDHVLISANLAQHLAEVRFLHEEVPVGLSDHYPIYLRFDFSQTYTLPGTNLIPNASGQQEFAASKESQSVRMVKILANPSGDEEQDEAILLKNESSEPVSLVGWTVQDARGDRWQLAGLGTLAPGESKTIRRSGQPMSLNNREEVVELIHPSGVVMQTFDYINAVEDEWTTVYDQSSLRTIP